MRSMRTDVVFEAVSEPTRRAMLDLLAAGERSVNELVDRFDVTQPAISHHLRILREAGLVKTRKAGRQRLYCLEARPLRRIHDWVAHYERFWTDKLDALGKYLRRNP
jgi:DNA-binding transcriptional ArsR family regulator